MTLETLMNYTQNMTSPDQIIKNLDPTGYFWDAFLYTLLVLIIFVTSESERYNRISKRFAVSSFVVFILAVFLYVGDFIAWITLFRAIIILVLSIIYLYVDEYIILRR